VCARRKKLLVPLQNQVQKPLSKPPRVPFPKKEAEGFRRGNSDRVGGLRSSPDELPLRQ
jgi:hypothetical protein